MLTNNSKIIQKYVPEKHIVGSSVEVDNSGYLLLRDNFISIFPSIMEYKEKNPFEVEDIVLRLKWCAYVIVEGFECLVISKQSTFESLRSEVEDNGMNWRIIPSWYITIMQEKEDKIANNIWATYLDKDIVTYLKLQQEYGYMQGESKNDKSLLFPKPKLNTQNFIETLTIILKDKVMKGDITQAQSKEIIEHAKQLKS